MSLRRHRLEVSGTYDLIVQGRCASFAEYSEQLESIRPHIAGFAIRVEPNFISKTIQREPADGQPDALWLPCEDGRRQVQASMINKVEAQGDYMLAHVGAGAALCTKRCRDFPSGFFNRASFD